MPTHHRFWGDEQERFLPPRPQLSESHPEHLVDRAQSPPRSFGMESQQLLTQCAPLGKLAMNRRVDQTTSSER